MNWFLCILKDNILLVLFYGTSSALISFFFCFSIFNVGFAVYVKSRFEGHAMGEVTQKLISDGLEDRLLSILEEHLSANYPEHLVSSI